MANFLHGLVAEARRKLHLKDSDWKGTFGSGEQRRHDKTKRELRLVLLGMSGVGKSATANTIIGKKHFKSSGSGSSVTFKCDHTSAIVQGRDVLVVDTPGLFDTREDNEHTVREISRCVGLSAPGPHALILVVRGADRQTEQVQMCADIIIELFGDQALGYMIVLFTRGDDLEFEGTSLPQFIETLPANMKQVIEKCDNRCLAFNNRPTSDVNDRMQVGKLIKMIDTMIIKNGGQCFSNEVYKDFEKIIVSRENKLINELEKKHAEEIKLVKDQVEKEILQMEKKDQEQAHKIMKAEIEKEKLALEMEREQLEKERKEHAEREQQKVQEREEMQQAREQEIEKEKLALEMERAQGERERKEHAEREQQREQEREKEMQQAREQEIEKVKLELKMEREQRERERKEHAEREQQTEQEREKEMQQAREQAEKIERERHIQELIKNECETRTRSLDDRYTEQLSNLRNESRKKIQEDSGNTGGWLSSFSNVIDGVKTFGRNILSFIW